MDTVIISAELSPAQPADTAAVPDGMPADAPVGPRQLTELTSMLQKYKAGKARTERRIVASENWWKLRNTAGERRTADTACEPFASVSGWLHNVIVSKHADALEAYPEPVILPREQSDSAQAQLLSSIIPCIMEQNNFEQTYSDVMWQKLKTGTGAYKAVWDADKLNGLGDIAIERVNLLNIYWEPGISDIQKSPLLFHTELVDKDALLAQYPQLLDRAPAQGFVSARFLYDDAVDTSGKLTVIECYYRKSVEGKNTVQYVKYVGDAVLYATENEPGPAERGLYDHGLYPYVLDALFPVEGSPCGYGYVDICRNPQTEIDLLKTAFVKNALVGSSPRYFSRADGGVNEEEFLDTSRPLVHVNGNLGEDSLRQIKFSPLDSVYVNVLDRTIQELRETSGNTETSTGNISSGVTAASAIAALQEASGKGSRDANLASYRAYSSLVGLVIELVRQFYDLPRQFRILGPMGMEKFVTYSNSSLQPQHQGIDFDQDMGCRLPVFDIRVSAQKRSAYSRVTQNELALQFFKLGFFKADLADQALECLNMMDFDGKDQLLQRIAEQKRRREAEAASLAPAQGLPLSPGAAPVASMGGAPASAQGAAGPASLSPPEAPAVLRSRSQTAAAPIPGGGAGGRP